MTSIPLIPDSTLPAAFDLNDLKAYFQGTLSEQNVKDCVRVLGKLIAGKGVAHKNKPGEPFCAGIPITPRHDLVALRRLAVEWLPHSGPNRLDRGNGWAINHPLTKLIEFQAHLGA